MHYQKPNIVYYRIAQLVSRIVSALLFRRKMVRNQIRGKKGAFVVIANHQCMLDFVNLIDATSRPLSFVVSQSFYNSLPLKKIMDKMGVIPKQQFQTAVTDMKRIRAVIEHGEPVVIYPAGLMCEDGLSTPIPAATYKFLKWLDTDVYMAKTTGAYFAMPKWSKKIRPGTTYMDVYQLFTKEELRQLDEQEIREKAEPTLLFDAYREQEEKGTPFVKGDNIEGLENVLYICPHCHSEFSMQVKDKTVIFCEKCGFAHQSDRFGFLHNVGNTDTEWRLVSDWSRHVYETVKDTVKSTEHYSLCAKVTVQTIHPKKDRFCSAGNGVVSLTKEGFSYEGTLHGQPAALRMSITNIPTLPFSPGRYFEIQHGKEIYRMVLEDGKLAMKFIHLVKAFYDLSHTTTAVK
jgi:1-acyl-sn-glycerol-3-phosphate acyltransferase